jgi:preprotein translocase subunit SecB
VADKQPEGYRLERIYVSNQSYSLEDVKDAPKTPAAERDVHVGWDWRPIGRRRFEVIIDIAVDPNTSAPEKLHVRLLGIFQAPDVEDPQLPFINFVRQNAPAILFPYAREVVSTMTGRGPYGSFHINPINVVAILGSVPIAKTTGYQFLESNASVAEEFALNYHG